MNQHLILAVSAAAMVVYQYEGKLAHAWQAQQPPTLVAEIKNGIAQVGQSISEEGVTKQSLRQDLDSIEAWEEKYGDAYHLAMAAQKAEFISKYEASNVHPFNPIEVACEQIEVLNEAGESVNTLSCAEEYSLQRHLYDSYETSLLEILA